MLLCEAAKTQVPEALAVSVVRAQMEVDMAHVQSKRVAKIYF